MSLSKQVKKQIEKEELVSLETESYRSEVRNKLNEGSKKKRIGCLTWLIILAIGYFVLILSFSNGTTDVTDNDDLSGNVMYNDFKFSLTNQEDVDWNNCHFTLNKDYGYPSSSFSDKIGPITAGETVTIPLEQFVKENGMRFNSLLIKPQSLVIDCNGRYGSWK